MELKKIRNDFPILKRKINGKRMVYLDSAATSQKPKQVIKEIEKYYENYNSNVHRGIYKIAAEATEEYEEARKKIAKFINAKSEKEIIFVRGATEAINLVRFAWAEKLRPEDEIISTVMEHHSNIVPWLMLKKKGIDLKFVEINDDGTLRMEEFKKLITPKTKLIAVSHVSNVLGTINPVKQIAKLAHENGARILFDSAQSVPHMPVDVQELDCDFMAFSGHKMFGPTGIGVLYVKEEVYREMEPFMGGGEMIKEVFLTNATWKDPPHKYEAGTPDISGAIALGYAVDYLEKIGMKKMKEHEKTLTRYALEKLSKVPGIKIYGPKNAENRGGVIAFNLGDIHAHDLATILDEQGVAIRSGHHCTMPLHSKLGVSATARASFSIYNTKEDVDELVNALNKARKVFGI
ncbi:MAG: cysteine desulfurase [Candidatus Aenigmarchaeota archaeon]|nr:cysteine desulfurase [Candidatus Aenigmarchaeota archaeon]